MRDEATAPEQDHYDSPWKAALKRYFPAFMAFFFPRAHAQIDWTQEYIFLDHDLREVVQDAELGKRIVDKLMRVVLRGGGEGWVYIHVEVQGTRQCEFAKRLFVYNYRLHGRYRWPVASLAVPADEEAGWRPDRFGDELFDCAIGLSFPVAKRLEQLLAAPNPFALVTTAHLPTRRTKGDPHGRFEATRRLVRLLYQRGWDRQTIIDLFTVIDRLMYLPEHLSQAIRNEIDLLAENATMRHVASVERLAAKEAWQDGHAAPSLEAIFGEAAH